MRVWFSSYTTLDSGEVLMDNGVWCHIEGIGNIWVKMFDGKVRVVKDVKTYSGFEEDSIILKGDRVIGGENRRNNVYCLQGSIVDDVPSFVSKRTKQLRLGHASEVPMQTMKCATQCVLEFWETYS